MVLDPRVIKTQRNIAQALIEVLALKPFEEIVVKDILDAALINRSTFYKYYSGKDDLAAKMIEDYKTEYYDLLRQRFTCANLDEFMKHVVPLSFSKRKLLLALWSIQTPRHNLYQDMFAMLKNEFLNYASKVHPYKRPDYQGTVFATLALTTARYYFERDQPVPIPEIFSDWQEMMSLVSIKINNS